MVNLVGSLQAGQLGAPGGIATLDGSSLVPIANVPTGTSASTVAVGNDSRIVGALQGASNLSDISSPPAALVNLAGATKYQVDVRADYGAVGDTRVIPSVSCNATSTIVHAPNGTFSSADVGRKVIVQFGGGAGTNTGSTLAWVGVGMSVNGTSQLTLSTTCTTSQTATQATIGTDDTSALASALAASRTVGAFTTPKGAHVFGPVPCYAPVGNYLATGPLLNVAANHSANPTFGFVFYGDGVDQTYINYFGTATAIAAIGNLGSGNVTSPNLGVAGGTVLTLPSTSGMVNGSILCLADPAQIFTGNNGNVQVCCAAEVAKVQQVLSSTQVQIYGGLKYTYGATSTMSFPVPLQGMSVSEMTIINPAPRNAIGDFCDVTCVKNLNAHDLRFDGLDGVGFHLQQVWDSHVRDMFFENFQDLQNPTSSTAPLYTSFAPYMIAFADWSANNTVSGITSNYGRHQITSLTSTALYPPHNNIIADCTGHNHSETVFDNHPGSRDFLYSNCAVYNTRNNGFQMRGFDHTIINPVCKVGSTTPDQVSTTSSAIVFVNGANGCTVIGGVIDGFADGIVMTDSNNCTIDGTKIINCFTNFVTTTTGGSGNGYPTPPKGFALQNVDIIGGVNSASAIGENYTTWDPSYRRKDVRYSGASMATTVSGRSANTIACTGSSGSPGTIAIPWNSDNWTLTGTAAFVATVTADESTQTRVIMLQQSGVSVKSGGNITLVGGATWNGSTLVLLGTATGWLEISRT